MAEGTKGLERRNGDAVAQITNDRINELGARLERHITDCSTQSRRLFWAVMSVLGFLIVKSLPFLAKMFPG